MFTADKVITGEAGMALDIANTNNSILMLIICLQTMQGFKYSYLKLIILSNMNHLFAHSHVVSSILIKH